MTDDLQHLLQSSFLVRVPSIAADLIRDGMEPHTAITQAIGIAKEREDVLCLLMIAPQGYHQTETAATLAEWMCEHVYARAQSQTDLPVNPRWEACRAALGREPEGWEFINWIASRKGRG